MQRESTRWAWIGALAAMSLVACVEEESDGQPQDKAVAEAPSLAFGKADASGLISQEGALEVGDEAARGAEFDGKGRFFAYELEVVDGAELTLEVTQKGSSRGLDTTLYVYGPRDEQGGWDEGAVAYDDDAGWGRLSRIRGFAPEAAGTYLVLVGTYSSKDSGRFRLAATCDNDRCTASEPVADCAFGSHYEHLFSTDSAMTVTSKQVITSPSQLDALGQEQLLAAVVSTYEGQASTPAEALALVDAGRVNLVRLWDASNRRPFVAYEFGAGDNSYGMILEADTTTAVAWIQDGDLVNCQVAWGPERKPCAAAADCAEGLRCHDGRDGQGVCLDASAPAAPEENEACQQTADCGEGQGLVCAGSSGGFGGVCVPAWMRRSFTSEPDLMIPDGEEAGVEATIEVWGLATVSTDVLLDLWVWHQDPAQLRVTLRNPLGTEVVVADGMSGHELYLDDEVLRGFPGDEDANGTWTLQVVDRQTGEAGRIARFGLTVTSRWD